MNSLIKIGLQTLLDRDRYMLENNVGERSITHRLGMYYQSLFPLWDVDCEFNRNLDKPKEITVNPQELLRRMANVLQEKSEYKHNVSTAEEVDQNTIRVLREQLLDESRLRYDEELDLFYFLLTLENGQEVVKNIAPDIIVHKRGSQDNLVVIEAKKSSNGDRYARAYDLVKLIVLVSDPAYRYKHGYFLDLPVGSKLTSHKKFTFRPIEIDKRIKIAVSS